MDPTKVNPIPAQGMPENLPHGIRGLMEYPFMWSSLLTWIILALVLIAVAAGIYWYFFKKEKIVKPIPKIHPLILWKEKIDTLQPQTPFEGKSQRDYYYQLSLTFRAFVEEKTGVGATDLTLKELKEPLERKLPLSKEKTKSIFEFLKKADMVKFADQPSNIEEAQTYHNQVKSWVDMMMPTALDLQNEKMQNQSQGES